MMRLEAVQRSGSADRLLGLRQRVEAASIPLVFAALLIAALAVRWWTLDAKSIWFDEAFSVNVALQPLLEIPRILRDNDTHPPFHYLLLNVWMKVFGRSELAIRSPSVLASLGVLALTFLLSRRVSDGRVAILATTLLAFSPFQITASQEARMYPFLALFTSGASYALWLALEEGRRRQWGFYVLLILLALYTHHFASLIVLAHALYVLTFHRSKSAIRGWLSSMGLVALGYAPMVPMFIAQFISARNWPEIRPPFGLGALTDLLGLLSFGGGLFQMGTYFVRGTLPLEYRAPLLAPFVLLLLAGATALPGRRERGYIVCYWLVPVAAVTVISIRWNIFYERYFSFLLPPFAILVAGGVFRLADAMRGPPRKFLAFGLLAILASFYIPAMLYFYRAAPLYNWRKAALYVTAKAEADDYIFYVPGPARLPFEYYYRGQQARMILNPREIMSRRDQSQFKPTLDPQKIAGISRGHRRMWIVATIPLGYEARLRLGKVLEPYFREIEGRDFGLVYIFLWESRLFGRAEPVR